MKLTLIFVTITLLGCAMPIDAQIVPAPRGKPVAVADAAMLFEDRGQQMEIYPALRAAPSLKPGGSGAPHQLSNAAEGAPIGPRNLGVVFNHSLQVRGYLTGEIAFKPKEERLPADFDAAAQWPGLAKVGNSNTYVVIAGSPRDFIPLFNRLKARSDLEWVEAVVIYGKGEAAAPRR